MFFTSFQVGGGIGWMNQGRELKSSIFQLSGGMGWKSPGGGSSFPNRLDGLDGLDDSSMRDNCFQCGDTRLETFSFVEKEIPPGFV